MLNIWITCLIILFLSGFVFIYWMGNVEQSIPQLKAEIETKIDSEFETPPTLDNVLNNEKNKEEELCPTLLIKRGKQLMLFNKNIPEVVGENPIFFNSLDQYIKYVELQRNLYGQTCPVLFLQEEVNAQGENVYRMRKAYQDSANIDPLMLGSVESYFKDAPNVMPQFHPPKGPDAYNKPPLNNSISLALYGTPLYENTSIPVRNKVEYTDANRDNQPYNQGYYGFDPSNQYVGKYTVLDQIHDSTKTQNASGLSDNPMDSNWGGAVFTHEQVKSGKYEGNEVEPPTNVSVLESQ